MIYCHCNKVTLLIKRNNLRNIRNKINARDILIIFKSTNTNTNCRPTIDQIGATDIPVIPVARRPDTRTIGKIRRSLVGTMTFMTNRYTNDIR